MIAGMRKKNITRPAIEHHCNFCHNNQFVPYGLIRYFHVYWIPIFTIWKLFGLECTKCQRQMTKLDFTPAESKKVKSLVFKRRYTFWYNIGVWVLLLPLVPLVLLLLLASTGIFDSV